MCEREYSCGKHRFLCYQKQKGLSLHWKLGLEMFKDINNKIIIKPKKQSHIYVI